MQMRVISASNHRDKQTRVNTQMVPHILLDLLQITVESTVQYRY